MDSRFHCFALVTLIGMQRPDRRTYEPYCFGTFRPSNFCVFNTPMGLVSMRSKERILAAISPAETGPPDNVPLTTWCFGFAAPAHLRWEAHGREVEHWYSMRMEHIHTLPELWALDDDFRRVRAWLDLGIDDVLDVSVPWSVGPEVTWEDAILPGPVLERRYHTPSGPLRHAVRRTGEDQGAGWVIQPDHVPLIEDMNIPRAVEHAVSSPADVPVVKHLYGPPDAEAEAWLNERMARVKAFADEAGVLVQAWSAFGMDAVVWLAGIEGAILLAMDDPSAFGRLVETIARTDLARTELAAGHPGVDLIVQRGWYSSTDFWSPDLFDQYVYPHVSALARVAHKHGKKFAYTMTTGVTTLGQRLVDAGVDVLYFVDPVQDTINLEQARDLFGGRLTLVGGINALDLTDDARSIREKVRRAMDLLGSTNRFILHPVDAIFPDTPWEGVETMIEAWKESQ